MSAPSSELEQTILNYLRLEFGEDDDDADALQLSDLKFEGSLDVSGVVAHYWRFPCGKGHAWVTATPTAIGFFMKDPVAVLSETGALDPNNPGTNSDA